jgi:hypothetical protein
VRVLPLWVRWVAWTVGAVSVGEALALAAGTLRRRSDWTTPAHLAYLASDVVLGAALVWLATVPLTAGGASLLALTLSVLAASHGWRAHEYVRRVPGAFCANAELFYVDVAKLVGVLLVAAGWIASG